MAALGPNLQVLDDDTGAPRPSTCRPSEITCNVRGSASCFGGRE